MNEPLKNALGENITLPFAPEQKCFGQRQGWCSNFAIWRCEGKHHILHFCDECKNRPNMANFGTWIKMQTRQAQ